MLDDVTTETCMTSDSEDYQNPVKKEESEDGGYLCAETSRPVGLIIAVDQQTEGFQRKPVKEEEPENDEFLYCEECKSYFTNKCEVHGPAVFISDTPVPMGITDRAIQTLPPGLGVRKSGIPDAGLGVFNKGETIPLGARFGPCEGDLVDREEAMNSGYSWVLDDVTAETCMTSDSEDYQNPVKKEEPEDGGYLCAETSRPVGLIIAVDQQTEGFQRKPVKEEEPENDEFLYCEECKSYFNKCEVHGQVLFISDTPIPMGITDRAIQTLPPGLEVRKSGIPDAGLGVFNKGETIPLGAQFGPCEGDLVDREEAMNSGYSWVISKSSQCEEYIDAKREMYSNWMRYVNCARNDEEQNLVAFQYRGGIFYRCCRPIKTGQELLMWYEDDYGKDYGLAFDYLWKKKCSSNEMNDMLLQVFCSWCPLSYVSQIYLDNHIRRSHFEEYVKVKNVNLIPTRNSSRQEPCSGTFHTCATRGQMQKEIRHCSNCGKGFTHLNNLKSLCVHTGENLSHCSHSHERDVLQRHQSIHTREKAYYCSQCGKCFTQQNTLQTHLLIHTGEKPHRCLHCRKSFNHQSSLRKHQRIHTGDKPYHCSQCGKSFNNGSNYRQHQCSHTVEKIYPCSHCGKNFNNSTSLQRHQSIHTGKKPYHCSQCGKRFTYHSNLKGHERIHTGEKPYHCSQCGKRFTYQSHLKDHERIHTGEKPYHCSQCGKSFNKRNTLQRHLRIHTEVKPYQCSQCGKMFNQQSDLQRHQRIHTEEKPYHCSQCGKRFTRHDALRRHQSIHTGEKPYQCPRCGKRFNHHSDLQKHQRTHTGERPH
ncbi:histone-lysine N-methyltransferase PRDM9-like isoform X2 [Neoarius graeffei]|uniref:histone-lysine N-methyltransferase PRDM9-like isoform X2 n=1 Tax=Neoarius graeffei TaxID=443677 RepID=UPI00298BEF6A|nr:histone-lysine N-methyltransferase PRDM9-like isoform X2 [Neoarius graeffei]